MNNDGTVSVVVPVYNRARLIGRCLDSIWAQSFRPLRVIVVDNASTDDTVEAVTRWRDRHKEDPGFELTLLSESAPGASAARNRGLREVTGKYTFFFDSDDEMLPGVIHKSVTEAERSGADIVIWRAEIETLGGKIAEKPYYESGLLRRHMYNALLATQIYMGLTDFFRKAGGWEARARVWNDWELGVRLLLARPKVSFVPEVMVRIHAQRESITGEALSHREGEWEKTLDIVDSDIDRLAGADRERMRRMTDFRRVMLAAYYGREGAMDPARRLLEQTLRRYGLVDRFRLRLLYHYTRLGGRGAYYFWQS